VCDRDILSRKGKGRAVAFAKLVSKRSNKMCKKYISFGFTASSIPEYNKKAQLSLTNPRDACEKFARFT